MPQTKPPCPPQLRTGVVRLVRESGKPMAQIARELGVSVESLRNWTRKAKIDAGEREGLTTAEREELSRLRRENRILHEEREFLKSRSLLCQGDRSDEVETFRFVEREKADHAVAALCRVLGVSTSGYYTWRTRGPSGRARQDAELVGPIIRIHRDSRGTYRAPRVNAELAMGTGIRCSMKTELFDRCSWLSRRALASAIFEYIESSYNRKRQHSTLGYLSPVDYERRWALAGWLLYGAQGLRNLSRACSIRAPLLVC